MSNIFALKRDKLMNLKKLRYSIENKIEEIECNQCKATMLETQLVKNLHVCPYCGHHLPMPAYARIRNMVDEGSFKERQWEKISKNPLAFPDYDRKLEINRKKTGLQDALVWGTGRMEKEKLVIAVLDSRFLMGSMGTVVGEKLVSAIEYATKKELPLVIFSSSGGARMQEGLFSLMQMAKTTAAVAQFQEAGGLYISCLTNPTTGGVSASYASLGDIIFAEPNALIGFAGPRVIQQTIGQALPEGFQTAEFVEKHGFLDGVVSRFQLRQTVTTVIQMHKKELQYGKS